MPRDFVLANGLEFISGYLLPFYLYLFLFLLVYDLLLLFNMLFKVVPREKLKSPAARKYTLMTILLLSVVSFSGRHNKFQYDPHL